MRKTSARTVINRKALTAISEGFAAGMESLGQAIVARTHPPDDPSTPPVRPNRPWDKGKIPVDYGVWAGGRKVAGNGAKPRGVRLGIVLIVGVGFPGRFNEIGTSHQPARPFFTPEVLAELPQTGAYLKPKVLAAMAGVK